MTELCFEQFVYFFENDDIFPVNETSFHFEGESQSVRHRNRRLA